MTTTASPLPLVLEEVEVTKVDQLSPSFVRVEFAAPGLAEFGVEGNLYDQRIKLIFPFEAGGRQPTLVAPDADWYTTWLALPDDERGHMRTYTVRDLRGEGDDVRLVVDIVVHEGEVGPAGTWGAQAAVGQRIVVLGPRRGQGFGGIEFAPGDASRLLLVGDETAVPAVAAILEQIGPDAVGAAFLEVPVAADVQTLQHPEGVEIHWFPRDGAERGVALHAAVLEHLGRVAEAPSISDDDVDPDLWETPDRLSDDERQEAAAAGSGADYAGLYAWIAGESKVVTGLRRALVKDHGLDRTQVAFMGYWRAGVAMRS